MTGDPDHPETRRSTTTPAWARGRSPFSDEEDAARAHHLGMVLFLIAIAVLFLAISVGYIVIRVQLGGRDLWPADLPAFPGLLRLSTILLILCSAAIQGAWIAARRNRHQAIRTALVATAVIGVVFLLLQLWSWMDWFQSIGDRWTDSKEYRFALTGFYMLTGLHALHLVGGFVGLGISIRNLPRGEFSPSSFQGLRACVMYWHFLAVAWVLIYALLLLSR